MTITLTTVEGIELITTQFSRSHNKLPNLLVTPLYHIYSLTINHTNAQHLHLPIIKTKQFIINTHVIIQFLTSYKNSK